MRWGGWVLVPYQLFKSCVDDLICRAQSVSVLINCVPIQPRRPKRVTQSLEMILRNSFHHRFESKLPSYMGLVRQFPASPTPPWSVHRTATLNMHASLQHSCRSCAIELPACEDQSNDSFIRAGLPASSRYEPCLSKIRSFTNR